MSPYIYITAVILSILLAAFSVSFQQKSRKTKVYSRYERRTLLPFKIITKVLTVLSTGVLLLAVLVVFLSTNISYYPADTLPSGNPDSDKIAIMQERIDNLEVYIDFLEQQRLILQDKLSHQLQIPITFNAAEYDGLTTFSIKNNKVYIALNPADGYDVICFDDKDNQIETYLNDSGEWYFDIPDKAITISIQKKIN